MQSTFGGMTLEETRAPAAGGKAVSWVAGFLAIAVVVAGGVAAAYLLHDRGSLFGGGDDGNGGGEAPGVAPPVTRNIAPNDPGEAAAAAASDDEAAPAAGATGFDLLVTPAGAEVTLDGKTIGVAPLRVRSIAPGRHTLDVAAPEGYFGHHTEIDLADGKAEVIKIELARVDDIAGGASDVAPLEADEAGADEDDEKITRPSRRETRRERRARRRAERAARPDEARDERGVEEGEREAESEEEPTPRKARRAASGATGTLMIGSKPPCDIYVDGKKTGLKTPQRNMVLAAGVHSVRLVSKEHGLDKRFKVRVAEDKTTRAIQDFTKDL